MITTVMHAQDCSVLLTEAQGAEREEAAEPVEGHHQQHQLLPGVQVTQRFEDRLQILYGLTVDELRGRIPNLGAVGDAGNLLSLALLVDRSLGDAQQFGQLWGASVPPACSARMSRVCVVFSRAAKIADRRSGGGGAMSRGLIASAWRASGESRMSARVSSLANSTAFSIARVSLTKAFRRRLSVAE